MDYAPLGKGVNPPAPPADPSLAGKAPRMPYRRRLCQGPVLEQWNSDW
ncbi:hypothetical protein EGYY_25050 [Eggerthella sp. YY7918]|nr:hypothetical protein EGYY_25050 [Eggerthella sp. YY7918]